MWRDFNRDGVAQHDELFGLEALGIQSLSLTHTSSAVPLASGNNLLAEAIYTRTDGSTGTLGEIDLADDTFRRVFTEPLPVSRPLLRHYQGIGLPGTSAANAFQAAARSN